MPRNASPLPPPTPAPPRAGLTRRGLLGLALAVGVAHLALVFLTPPTRPEGNAEPAAVQTAPVHATAPMAATPQPPAADEQAPPRTPAKTAPSQRATTTSTLSAAPAAPTPQPKNSKPNHPLALSEKAQATTQTIAPPSTPAPTALTPSEPAPAAQARPGEDVDATGATVPRHVVLPGNVALRYAVSATRKGMTLSADSTLRLTVSDLHYDAQLTLQAWLAGARVQTSRGELDAHWGLVPQRFGDKNRSKAEQAAHFDRSRQPATVRFSANTPDAPLPQGAQDRLSVLLQLAAMLEGEPQRYTAGQHIRIYTVGPRDAEWWDFEVKGPEALDLPAGPMTALHLLRTPTQPYDNRVELWMAPALGHLPVRVLWTQANGDVVDQRLSSHSP